jgi:hypothetical protein
VASYTRTSFTATAGQTTFTATYTVGYVQVYLNGVFLNGSDYTATNGTSVVLATAAALNDIIEIIALNVNSIGTGPTGATGPAGTGGASWQAVQTASFTAAVGNAYPVNTTSGSITVTLPASPSAGNYVQITDYAGTFPTNFCIVNPNGGKIGGSTSNLTLSVGRESIALVYIDSTQGWIPYSGLTSNIINYPASYLIVAGGGGGGNNGGGGGAGGFVTGTTSLVPNTVYTVTVGAAGAINVGVGTYKSGGDGGSSSISGSLTTAVGGGGGGGADGNRGGGVGNNGGSGGGGGWGLTANASGGSGTSGQGNNGGASSSTNLGAGGGGGAGALGGTGSGAVSGNGGIGISSSITGTATYYAGGGGGGTGGATGGTGGGGNGGSPGSAGTVNTGGGGGGGGGSQNGGTGGSGVVIISVPTVNYTGTVTGSPTVTTDGSNKVIKFTTSGSYTA